MLYSCLKMGAQQQAPPFSFFYGFKLLFVNKKYLTLVNCVIEFLFFMMTQFAEMVHPMSKCFDTDS